MIRRQVGQECWLITQNDHAEVSGTLAGHLGNNRFTPPTSASAIRGISLHDCGWPIHDDEPTLNGRRQPLDVFETPRPLALQIWEISAQRAAAEDDYAGLLVSLHGMALSVFATGASPVSEHHWKLSDTRARFEVNRFQHAMIEMQETLRPRLKMRTDQPLKNGLAENSSDPKEQRLTFDFRWLQAMDRLSLAICCTKQPFETMEPVLPKPGAAPVSIRVRRQDPLPDYREREHETIALDPWPFAEKEVTVTVPFRRLAALEFADEATFRAAYALASAERFTVLLQPHTI